LKGQDMERTTIPTQRDGSSVRCQGGTGRCPNDAAVVVIENPAQPYAKRYLCAKHYGAK
jgi:hypothetical protein